MGSFRSITGKAFALDKESQATTGRTKFMYVTTQKHGINFLLPLVLNPESATKR
jgi:hypothetical protein